MQQLLSGQHLHALVGTNSASAPSVDAGHSASRILCTRASHLKHWQHPRAGEAINPRNLSTVERLMGTGRNYNKQLDREDL